MKRKEDYTEEDEKALRNLETAATALKRASGGKQGESAENQYLIAYTRCYRLGLKQYPPKIGLVTR
jgi:hypothetical protein